MLRFRSYFVRNDDFNNSFWNLLTFRTLWYGNSFSIIMTRYGKNAVWNDFVLPTGLDSSTSSKQRLTRVEFYKISSKNDKMRKMVKVWKWQDTIRIQLETAWYSLHSLKLKKQKTLLSNRKYHKNLMWQYVPQWWVEFDNELCWLFFLQIKCYHIHKS